MVITLTVMTEGHYTSLCTWVSLYYLFLVYLLMLSKWSHYYQLILCELWGEPMNNERKESEQSGHGPIKDASLECIWSEQKNKINERTVSFQNKIQSREANYMDWLWVIWLLKLSEAEWDEMTYKYDEMERTKEMDVSYLTLQVHHVYGEIKKGHKTYSAWPTFQSTIFQVQVMLPEPTCLVLTCYYYGFLTRNF